MEGLTFRTVPIGQLEIVEAIGHTTLGPDRTSSRDTFAAFVNPFVLGAFDSVDSFMVVRIVVVEQQHEFDNMEYVDQLSLYH